MTATEHRFPCEACGADMRFDPEAQAMLCPNCGATEKIDDGGPWGGSAIREQDFRAALEAALPDADIEETRVLSCTSCGAQVEFEPDVHAAECPFCATPVVTGTGTHRHIKPRAVLPFVISETTAREKMGEWLGNLWFAPSGISKYARKGRRMEGVYVPYWTYDAATRSAYAGQRGTVYYETRTRTVNGKRTTERVQRVRWTPVTGRVARDFDDVLVLASTSLPRTQTDAIAPWDLEGLEPYDPAWLAGFRAEAYRIELSDGFVTAREIMDARIRRDIRFDIGGDRQRIERVETDISDVTFKHVLLPIWMAAYRFGGKPYRVVINARTGAVTGDRPWSRWKIALAVLIGALIAGGVGYLLATN